MKKSILAVAGLAAVAGIAAPVAGAFATDPTSTANVSITVSSTASITATAPTMSSVTLGSTAQESTGTGSVSVSWNNVAAYDVTYTGADLTDSSATTTIAATTDTTIGDNEWGFGITAGQGETQSYLATSSGTLLSEVTTKGTGQSTGLSFKASITDATQVGTYAGDLVFTLSEHS